MKIKIMLTGAMVLMTIALFSQSSITFGITAGGNLFNTTGKDGAGHNIENKIKPGFNVGFNADIPIGIDFYLQPGLMYITKGGSGTFGSGDKLTISYIQMPVNLLYKPELGKKRLLLGFGPYVGFAVGGDNSSSSPNREVKFKNNITTAEYLSNTIYLKRLDAGANLLVGYELSNRISVQLDASLGLINILPNVDGHSVGKSSYKNTGFGISFRYRLGN